MPSLEQRESGTWPNVPECGRLLVAAPTFTVWFHTTSPVSRRVSLPVTQFPYAVTRIWYQTFCARSGMKLPLEFSALDVPPLTCQKPPSPLAVCALSEKPVAEVPAPLSQNPNEPMSRLLLPVRCIVLIDTSKSPLA